MPRKYFGTDGIRGEVGQFPITPEFILRLGCAFGRALAKNNTSRKPTVIIGKDTRISGYMLETALVAGFTAAGVNVVQTGPLPTPGIAYLTRALRLDGGVMISASHNVFSDNGIKFFAEGGVKLSDEMELAIEAELEQDMHTLPSRELGRARRISGADDRYIEFCKSTFPASMNLRGLKLVVDTANGAGYHTAPKVFHELGAEVISIGNEPNGFNINEKTGATYTKTLQAAVLQNDADYGIALDGDGDRLMMADKNGAVYDGDKLLYIIAALQVLSSLQILNRNLAGATDWQPYPQSMINVRIQKGQDWQAASKEALAQAERELGEHGRVVLRASGTEPVVRVMVEADSAQLAEQCALSIAQSIAP